MSVYPYLLLNLPKTITNGYLLVPNPWPSMGLGLAKSIHSYTLSLWPFDPTLYLFVEIMQLALIDVFPHRLIVCDRYDHLRGKLDFFSGDTLRKISGVKLI